METITAGVHQVHRGVNAFIVDGDDGVTLVDTGLPRQDGLIRAALATIGRSMRDVHAIAITHAHVDHVGGAAALERDSDAALYASAVDAPAVRGEVPNPDPPVARRLGPLRSVFRLLPDSEAVAVDHEVGETLDVALPADLQVIDTPGHTPGHVSYLLDRSGGVLFVGDAAVTDRRGEIRRGIINAGAPAAFDRSLRHLADFDFDIACFGHADAITTTASATFRRFVATLG
jgi:glyoxylase-like metal-dependent hydrolase (beta-lactamase superfamily II)